jgi:hypothetical protein
LISFVIPAVFLVLILFVFGALLRNKANERYVSLLLVLGILTWLQGNFFVWNYGLLDGQGFNWSQSVWRGWIDGTIWILLLALAVIWYRKIFRIAVLVSLSLFSLQMALLLYNSVQNPEIWKHSEEYSLSLTPPEKNFEYSSTQNVIHIILDDFQSDIFGDIIDENQSHYYQNLEGFTFFKENTGSFPTTYMSMPAILSRRIYQNNIPMKSFTKKVFKGKTIPNVLMITGMKLNLFL